MRTTKVIRFAALVVALTIPAALSAQRAGATNPFRAGQWGAEFAASNDFQSLGMVRFFSARRALAFDVQLENTSSSIDGSQAEDGSTTYGLSVGYRMYRPVTTGVVGHFTGGVVVNSASTSVTTGGGATTETSSKGYGPFAEVGASYFVTPHLSLGAAYGLRYLINNEKTEAPGGTTESSGHTLGSSPLSVRISLWF